MNDISGQSLDNSKQTHRMSGGKIIQKKGKKRLEAFVYSSKIFVHSSTAKAEALRAFDPAQIADASR